MSPNIPSPASSAQVALREAHMAGRRGEAAQAQAAAQRAVDLDPDFLEAWYFLGSMALSTSDFSAAEQAFAQGARRTPEASPTQAQFLVLRAQALTLLGRTAEAVEAVRAGAAIGIDAAPGLIMAGTVFSQAGLEPEAEPLLRKAVEVAPGNAEAWFALGGVLQFSGDMKGAEAAFEASIACGMRTGAHVPLAHMSLARLRRWTGSENHIARLEALQCRNSLDAACVAYSLFKEYDDIGNREAAWDALQHGAAIGRTIDPWTIAEDQVIAKAWREHLPPQRFSAPDTRPRPGPKRIFIVGLPRSGTTLVERILAAHSQVQAIGEVKAFGVAVKHLTGITTPELLDAETIAGAVGLDPLALAERYSDETAYLSDGSAFTIDKLPRNHEYLGLIRLAFPDAILIHVRRNPMDSLFGAFKLLFSHAHRWSYDQTDLAEHYREYRALMAYWRDCLGRAPAPSGLIDVSLEAIIAEPETEIRRLLDLCGLPFEPACLRPHEAKGAVATASSAQVRVPINAEGVGVWRRYEKELEPLRQALLAMRLIDDQGNAVGNDL